MSQLAPLELLEKLSMLERSVLELGTEVFTLKNTIHKNKESQEKFLSVVQGLKQLLDEKGLITLDDFEAAVELGEALENFNSKLDDNFQAELDRMKSTKN